MTTNKGKQRFSRERGQRRYRKIFVIATEGSKTEPEYFRMLGGLSNTQVTTLSKTKKSSPKNVLQKVKHHLENNPLEASDEAWIVCDKDQWTDQQLQSLSDWANLSKQHGLAVSNPCFELWLLLHFESGSGATTSQACTKGLKKHLLKYDKGIPLKKFLPSTIDHAIQKALERDQDKSSAWPITPGVTRVYLLVQRIMAEQPKS